MHAQWNASRPRSLANRRCATWLIATVLIGALGAAGVSAAADAPPAEPAEKTETPTVPEILQLDDPLEPFEALRPRTGRDEDHIRALALFAAARVAEQKQDYEQALRNYQRAYRLDPNAVAALREIVPLAFNLDRQEEGVRYALIMAERDPSDATMLRRLAIYLTEDGDIERALALYERAVVINERTSVKLSPDSVMMWMEMARLYFVAKKFDRAADYFAKVIDALENPKKYELTATVEQALAGKGELTYQLFGECFLQAGRETEALAAFEKANEIKADEARHLYNLARVDAKKKLPAQALAKLEQYLAGHFATQGTGPYDMFAEALTELGQEDQLFDRLEKHRAADSGNMPLAYFLAERYRKTGQLDKAEPIYRAILEDHKKLPPPGAIAGLVEIYVQQKDAEKLLATLGKLSVLGDSINRAVSLELLGETGKMLAANAEMARAAVDEAQKQLAAAAEKDDAKKDAAENDAAKQDDAAKIDSGPLQAAALLALSLDDFVAAETLYNAALEADDAKKARLLETWGLQLFMDKHYDQAVPVLKRGLELPDEERAKFAFYLAGALEMNGQTDEAIEQAQRAAELNDDPRYASRVAWVQFHAKRYDEARKSYLELVEKFDKKQDPPAVRDVMRDARLVLSNLSVMEGKMLDAEEWLEQVLDEFPEDAGAQNDLGYLWADSGKHLERAHEMIQAAVADDPKNMAYRDSLGWVLFRLGKYPEAVAELTVAAAAPNPDGVVLDHLGEALQKNGDTAAAVEAWQRAIDAFEATSQPEQAKKVREKLKQVESQPKPVAATPKEPAADSSQPDGATLR